MTDTQPLKSYEVAVLEASGGVQEIGVMDVDPEQALEAATRTYIRDHVRRFSGTIENPHLDTKGVEAAVSFMTGARVYERFYPEGPIGLRQKLVLDFDAKTLRDKAKRVFEKAA